MKSSIVVFIVVLAASSVVQAEIDKEKAIAIMTKCKEETGATEDVEKMINEHLLPTTHEGKCMVACALKSEGVIKDDKVDMEAVSKLVIKAFNGDEEKAAAIVAKCSTIDVEGLDQCERAVAYIKCGHEAKHEM